MSAPPNATAPAGIVSGGGCGMKFKKPFKPKTKKIAPSAKRATVGAWRRMAVVKGGTSRLSKTLLVVIGCSTFEARFEWLQLDDEPAPRRSTDPPHIFAKTR